jgi:CRP-like cAMP-binding protein
MRPQFLRPELYMNLKIRKMNNLLLNNKVWEHKIEEKSNGLMFQNDSAFKKKEVIHAQDDQASRLFLIKSGVVKIVKLDEKGDQIINDILVEGEIFGEWDSLINPESRYNRMAICLNTGTVISSVKINQLNENIRHQTFISLSPIFLDRKIRQEKRLENLLKRNSTYRVKEQLIYLAKKAGRKVGTETLLKINLSHQDIASFSDTSRQTVTTIFNEMRDEGKIYYTRDRILFRDLDHLHD